MPQMSAPTASSMPALTALWAGVPELVMMSTMTVHIEYIAAINCKPREGHWGFPSGIQSHHAGPYEPSFFRSPPCPFWAL